MSVRVHVDGRTVSVPDGISLAAALVSTGHWAFRRHAVSGQPRGPFCGMGVCFECELTVDGRPGVRACLAPVRDDMRVETATPPAGSGTSAVAAGLAGGSDGASGE